MEYGRSAEKVWVYGGLRVRDGHAVTLTAPSRNSAGYQQFLGLVEQANPTAEIAVITDDLSSHFSFSTRTWLAEHARPAGVHSGRSVLAEPAGGVVAACRRARPAG